jgi:hypothetical protein
MTPCQNWYADQISGVHLRSNGPWSSTHPSPTPDGRRPTHGGAITGRSELRLRAPYSNPIGPKWRGDKSEFGQATITENRVEARLTHARYGPSELLKLRRGISGVSVNLPTPPCRRHKHLAQRNPPWLNISSWDTWCVGSTATAQTPLRPALMLRF